MSHRHDVHTHIAYVLADAVEGLRRMTAGQTIVQMTSGTAGILSCT